MRCVFLTVNSVTKKFTVIRRTKRNTERERENSNTHFRLKKNKWLSRTQKLDESAIRSRRELSHVVYDIWANQSWFINVSDNHRWTYLSTCKLHTPVSRRTQVNGLCFTLKRVTAEAANLKNWRTLLRVLRFFLLAVPRRHSGFPITQPHACPVNSLDATASYMIGINTIFQIHN
jgi:hypothetical protein